MKIYIIADTHFGHEKIISLCYRPDNYQFMILKNTVTLPKDAMLIHLGDVCLGKDLEVHNKYIEKLPCKKILVRGNHDHKSDNWYLNHGWDFVCKIFMAKYYGKYILFSHKPYLDIGYDINIHGHFHNTDHRSHEPELVAVKNNKQILYALEYNDYKPLSLEKIIRGIDAESNL